VATRLKTTVKAPTQCFSTFLLQRNLPQMFALIMEPYAMIQVSILHSVINEFRPRQFWAVSTEPLAATRGTPVEKHCSNLFA